MSDSSETRPMQRARPEAPIAAWLLLAVSVLVLLYGCWQARWLYADDAFITFRYAENLARGSGPVFNAGEYVEGYSTPLYMFALAGASALGLELMQSSRVLGIASMLAILAVLYRGLRSAGVVAWGAALTTFWLSTCLYLHLSSVAGMETIPHALLFFGGLVLLGGPNPTRKVTLAASSLLILSSLTRPEGIAFWGLGLLLVAATNRRQVWVYLWPFALFAAHLAWRYGYYGDLLPNTYYAKVGGGAASYRAGLAELWKFLENPAHLAWLLLAAAGAYVGASLPSQRRRVLVMSVAVVFQIGFSVSVGGDSIGLKRFCLPALPPLAFLVGLAFLSAAEPKRWLVWRRRDLAVVQALVLCFSLLLLLAGTSPVVRDTEYGEGNRKLGEHLAKTRDPSTLVAVVAAGAIPYFSGLPTLDLLGLNDHHIARQQPFPYASTYTGHAKWDSSYVLSREPDLVVVNRGYLPAGRDHSEAIERARRDPKSVASDGMEQELFSLLLESRRYLLRVLDLEDGSHFFAFERIGARSRRESSAPAVPARPNVLLVVVDTLRADHLSHYGHDRETSVGLDELAAQAARFVRAYSVSPLTGPSTASLLTGLSPETHGVKRTGERLSEEAITLAEQLQHGGWKTAGFSHNVVVTEVTGFAQGFDEFVGYRGRLRAYPDVSTMVDPATRWLRRVDKPFFLYLHPMNVHGPYKVPEWHASDLLGRRPSQGFQFYGPVMSELMDHGELAMRERVSPEMLTSLQEQYDTAIRYTCDQIARVIDELRVRDLYDDTLVVIAADHGEELFDHEGFGHGYTLYREVLHVPLLIKLPGQSSPRTIEAPVSLLDVYPTVLEALGLPLPGGLHGRSLLPVLRGGAQAEDERVLYFHSDARRMTGRALLTSDYKLIQIDRDYEKRRSVWQLFDVEEDPLEFTDLASSRPEVVTELAPQLEARSEGYRNQSPGDAENVRDQLPEGLLRSLGYVE